MEQNICSRKDNLHLATGLASFEDAVALGEAGFPRIASISTLLVEAVGSADGVLGSIDVGFGLDGIERSSS